VNDTKAAPAGSKGQTQVGLADLLALLSSDEWKPQLYAQTRTDTGTSGKSLGPPIPVGPDTDYTDVERELCRRANGAVRANVVLFAKVGQTRSPTVVVEVDAPAAAFYLAERDAAGGIPAKPVDPADALRAELAELKAKLREPQTTSLVASDPFSLALKVQEMNDKAMERAITLLRSTAAPPAPAPTSTSPTSFEFWMTQGRELAMAQAAAQAKQPPGTDWATVLTSPVVGGAVEKLFGVFDRFASAREKEAEAKAIAAEAELARVAGQTGAPLKLVSPTPTPPAANDGAGE
jgi:hypothetical protein